MKSNKAVLVILLGLFITLIAAISVAATCGGYSTTGCNNNYNNHYYFGSNCLYFPCTGSYNYQQTYYYTPTYTYSWYRPTYSWFQPSYYYSWYRPTYNYGGWGNNYYGGYNNYYGGYNNYYGGYGGYGWPW